MNRKRKLSASMSPAQFDRGYWYATELKGFAQDLGMPSAASLRKDELELAIKQFLLSGTIAKAPRRYTAKSVREPRDVDLGLRLDRRVIRYTNDPTTKGFLEREARRLNPEFRRRSGAMYRLNRWRERQIENGVALTYRDVVREYVRLAGSAGRFDRVPHGRYINFMSDYMAQEPRATRQGAVKAWHRLKTMDCEKTYDAWTHARSKT